MGARPSIALQRFVRAVDWLSFLGAAFGAALLLFIAFGVFYEVVARYVFQSPTEWSLELTGYALVWAGFLGAAYALQLARHVEVDLIVERLSMRASRRLRLVTDLIAFVFCAVVVRYGISFVHHSYVTDAASVSPLRVPLFLPELGVPLGIALLGLQFLVRILEGLGLVGSETDA